MARNKKNNEGEMGSGDSDDEFYNVKVPYDSGVAGDKPYGKSNVKKVYSPPRTKVKYDYKFESSSDEESQNVNSKKNKKELNEKSLGHDDNENGKQEKSVGDNNKPPQSASSANDKISEESHKSRNTGDKASPDAIENVSTNQNAMTPSMSSTVNVPRPQIGVVPSMVVMPPSMVVPQNPVMTMGSMIVPSAVGMTGHNIMPGTVNLIQPQNMMGVAGGMLRGPNPIGGLITNPSNPLPTNMMGMNSVPNQMAGVVGMQGNFVGIPGGGAQAINLQGNMINLAPMSGINMAVPGNMLRMTGGGSNMLRMQGPGGSIMGMQVPNNVLGIPRANSNIMGAQRPVSITGAPGNLMGVQPPTTGMIRNPGGMVVNPSNVMNNSLVGNPGNMMVMSGMMGNPGSLGNPNVVGASQSNLMNKVPYAQENSPSTLRGVPPPLMNFRGKPGPGNFRWQTNAISQSNPPKPDSPTETKCSSSSSIDRESKDEDGDELSRDDRDKLSDHSSALDSNESQPSARELPNSFKNDGSFMEIFKKMREGSNLEKDASGDKSGKSSDAGDSSSVKKPAVTLSSIVGKRRGGRVLKTGLVKKVKKDSEVEEEKNPKDAWSMYMAEVKKYREASCEEEGKTRPLVK